MGVRLSKSFVAMVAIVSLAGSARGAGQHPAAAPQPGRDGPFGIAMGEPLESVGALEPLGRGSYTVRRPPLLPNDFEGVGVTGFPDLGVCRIVGVTKRFVGDSSGSQAKLAVDNIARQITAKYGAYVKKVDDCVDPTGCKGGWLAAVQDNRADYHYSWGLAKQQRSDRLYGIILRVSAVDPVTSQGSVTYFSTDEQACENEEEAAS